jgi:hypothetical protein
MSVSLGDTASRVNLAISSLTFPATTYDQNFKRLAVIADGSPAPTPVQRNKRKKIISMKSEWKDGFAFTKLLSNQIPIKSKKSRIEFLSTTSTNSKTEQNILINLISCQIFSGVVHQHSDESKKIPGESRCTRCRSGCVEV